MSKVKFKLDKSAVKREILQSDWMKSHIEEVAEKQADRDSHIKSFIGFDRAKAIIYPNTKEHKK